MQSKKILERHFPSKKRKRTRQYDIDMREKSKRREEGDKKKKGGRVRILFALTDPGTSVTARTCLRVLSSHSSSVASSRSIGEGFTSTAAGFGVDAGTAAGFFGEEERKVVCCKCCGVKVSNFEGELGDKAALGFGALFNKN